MTTKAKKDTVEKTDMSISEAIDEIQKFQNVFRGAEKLKEALLVVGRLEGQKIELETAIKDLSYKSGKAHAEAETIANQLASEKKEFEQQRADMVAKLKAQQLSHEVELKDLGERLSRDSVAVRDKIARDLRAEQAKLDELMLRRGDLQKEIRDLEQKKGT